MTFYKLWHSVIPDVIGNAEIQIKELSEQDYHFDAPYAYSNVSLGRRTDYDFRIPKFELTSKSKFTDLLNHVNLNNKFITLSEKALGIIERKLKLPEYHIYDIEVYKNEKLYTYKGLHFYTKFTGEFINWSKSSFLVKYEGRVIERDISFKSYEDFHFKRNQLRQESNHKKLLKVDTICCCENMEYDLFFSGIPMYGVFCSSRLLELIINNNLSGFRFTEVAI